MEQTAVLLSITRVESALNSDAHTAARVCVSVYVCTGTHWKQNSSRRPETLPGTQKKEQADNTTHSALWFVVEVALSDVRAHTLHFALSNCMGLL